MVVKIIVTWFQSINIEHVVDLFPGPLSIQCYLSSLDKCYASYCAKSDKKNLDKDSKVEKEESDQI